jgi:hypothetical protein
MPRALILAYLERLLRDGFTGRIEIECANGKVSRVRVVTEVKLAARL